MKLVLLLVLLLVQVLCFSLLSSPSHGRIPPFLSPIPGPALPSQGPPIPLVPTAIAAPPQGTQVTGEVKRHHLDGELFWATIIVSVAVGSILLSCLFACVFKQKNQKKSNMKSIQSLDVARALTLDPNLGKISSLQTVGKKRPVSLIEYSMLEAATNDWSDGNILGAGGSGRVYKAHFDANFSAAVKKLDCQGQESDKEFENEVVMMSRVQHPNIVSLIGYCIHGQRRFLVFELMQNESLETQLHGPSHGKALSWHLRVKVALDVARGLEYLHEHCNPPVIHRDLKSSNILLDSNFNGKVFHGSCPRRFHPTDFGLAINGGGRGKSEISLSGTLGYVAPEYLSDGKLTEKSDVYAFGVVLLELLTGRRAIEKMEPSQCNQSIVTWAMPQLTDRLKLPNIIDPVIRNTMDLKHLFQVAAVAVLCVQQEPSYRPLITDVLHSLIPLVPVELGGTLKIFESTDCIHPESSHY